MLLAESTTGEAVAAGVGVLALLVLPGVLLLVLGLRARKRAAEQTWTQQVAWAPMPPVAPVAEQPWDAAWQAAPAPPVVQRSRGTKRIVAGSVLLGVGLLGLVGVAGAAAGLGEDEQQVDRLALTTVRLPPSLLGLQRDDRDLAEERASFLTSMPKGFDQADMGFYGENPGSLLVVASRGDIRYPANEIRGFKRGAEKSSGLNLGTGEDVPPGPLGGKVHCWFTRTGPQPVGVCAMAGRTSLVATFDFTATSLAQAEQRALKVRSAVVVVAAS